MTSLVQALHSAGVPSARDDSTTRALYSTDASLYRVPPQVVAFPRAAEEVLTALDVARRLGVPVTARGAGTSVAGNAVGPGLVLDYSRHLNRIHDVDPETRTAVVDPGVVQQALQDAAAPHGLRFGPDPSTSTRCTIGGMIGNNACGSRTLGYGRTADNVVRLRGVLGTGTPFDLRVPERDDVPAGGRPVEADRLDALVDGALGPIRTELGRFGRQASGYSMEHLLPEHGRDLARFLVGSEGTLGLLTEATVRLVSDPTHRVLVALGYADIATAGDAAPAVLAHRPTACEGLDARLVDVLVDRRGQGAVPDLPRGAAWLFTEISGDDRGEVLARAEAMAADGSLGAVEARVVTHPGEQAALWRIRADGAGLAGRAPSGRPAHAGWEDAAVPPERLGDYLRDFDALTAQHGLTSSPFGHFGEGCMHVRLDLPLDRPDTREVLREFMGAAADLVATYGGSLSGEHGDGRARSELLPRMYSPEVLQLFGAVKAICDPDDVLNPGVLVRPAPLDDDLRFPNPPVPQGRLALAWAHDDGDLSQAIHRCTGVGKCRASTTGSGGVMCPSYLATGDEKDSTRGRSRVLQEMINGSLVTGGWRAPEVHEALDLCLSCKGCASDCPTGVDMASYKAEVLHQAYRGRLRPVSHYTLGYLPALLRAASMAPKVASRAMSLAGKAPHLLRAAGVDPRRGLPGIAPRSFRRLAAELDLPGLDALPGLERPVVLLLDAFTDHLDPQIAVATVRVLRAAGYSPVLPPASSAFGLTLISTGQLGLARRSLERATRQLVGPARDGVPLVGLEPSCTAVLRHELTELLPGPDSEAVRDATRTLAELLTSTAGWQPPDLSGVELVAQPHCHHHAVMTWRPDAELLAATGAAVTRVGGCCGLAGNFGMEVGHYDVSVKVAEHDLLPAVRAASPDAVVLADGFSCRTQLADLEGRKSIHLAELLEQHLPQH